MSCPNALKLRPMATNKLALVDLDSRKAATNTVATATDCDQPCRLPSHSRKRQEPRPRQEEPAAKSDSNPAAQTSTLRWSLPAELMSTRLSRQPTRWSERTGAGSTRRSCAGNHLG